MLKKMASYEQFEVFLGNKILYQLFFINQIHKQGDRQTGFIYRDIFWVEITFKREC